MGVRDYCSVLLPKLVNEFIGTFFLVLVVCLTSSGSYVCSGLSPAFAIGSMLMVLVFMGGHVSGAHYNPAVTLGIFCAGRSRIAAIDAACYILTQMFGSLVAAGAQFAITGKSLGIHRGADITAGGAMLVEGLFTFILVTVVLNVATTVALESNSFYGTAIGFCVISGVLCVGQVSGGVFNPAVAFGPVIVNALSDAPQLETEIWIYYIGCCGGAIVAALVFRITNWGAEYGQRREMLSKEVPLGVYQHLHENT